MLRTVKINVSVQAIIIGASGALQNETFSLIRACIFFFIKCNFTEKGIFIFPPSGTVAEHIKQPFCHILLLIEALFFCQIEYIHFEYLNTFALHVIMYCVYLFLFFLKRQMF